MQVKKYVLYFTSDFFATPFVITLLASPYTKLTLNKAFQGWHEIKVAYRFFDHENVSPEKILTPHKEAAISRIKDSNSKIILCVQDATILDYTHRQKRVEDLGKIPKDHEQGFLLYTTIAFTPDKLCLGLLNYKTWARKELKGKILQRKIRPVEEKESMRWIESYMVSNALALEHRDKLFINIADREADFMNYWSNMIKLPA